MTSALLVTVAHISSVCTCARARVCVRVVREQPVRVVAHYGVVRTIHRGIPCDDTRNSANLEGRWLVCRHWGRLHFGGVSSLHISTYLHISPHISTYLHISLPISLLRESRSKIEDDRWAGELSGRGRRTMRPFPLPGGVTSDNPSCGGTGRLRLLLESTPSVCTILLHPIPAHQSTPSHQPIQSNQSTHQSMAAPVPCRPATTYCMLLNCLHDKRLSRPKLKCGWRLTRFPFSASGGSVSISVNNGTTSLEL